MERIESDDGQTIAIIVRKQFNKDGINFISENHYPLQVGINTYKKTEKIKPHSHLNRELTVKTTQEVVYIKKGKAKLDLYDKNSTKFKSLTLSAGDLVFFVSGGHGFEIKEDTTIIEVKQGPYNGKSKDKVMIE